MVELLRAAISVKKSNQSLSPPRSHVLFQGHPSESPCPYTPFLQWARDTQVQTTCVPGYSDVPAYATSACKLPPGCTLPVFTNSIQPSIQTSHILNTSLDCTTKEYLFPKPQNSSVSQSTFLSSKIYLSTLEASNKENILYTRPVPSVIWFHSTQFISTLQTQPTRISTLLPTTFSVDKKLRTNKRGPHA